MRSAKDKNLVCAVINAGNYDEYAIKQLAEETLSQMLELKSQLAYRLIPPDDIKRCKSDILIPRISLTRNKKSRRRMVWHKR